MIKGLNDRRAETQGTCMPISNGDAERMQEQQARLHQNLQRRGSSSQINFQGCVQVYDTHVDQRNCEMEMQIARNILDNQ